MMTINPTYNSHSALASSQVWVTSEKGIAVDLSHIQVVPTAEQFRYDQKSGLAKPQAHV